MSKFIMTLDQGTTSSRCILYDKNGQIVSMVQREFKQYYPKAGWVEHDGVEIWSSQLGVATETLAKVGATYKDIDSIGITNQRETTLVWDKDTGQPIHNAIVWQCRRTADYCDELKQDTNLVEKIKAKTGLLVDAYFSATKLKWLLDNVPNAREKAENGKLLFGTIETWLIWNLTGGRSHLTDYSNASRTMLFNINTLEWDDELLDFFDIPKVMLPKPMESSGFFGETEPYYFGAPIVIGGCAGDQQAALFGQKCFHEKQAKNTYGTGCFLLMNTGESPVFSNKGLLTTIAWGLNGKVTYALEGSVFVAGAAVQWLRDELGILTNAKESEELANSIEDTNGVVVVPAFVGMGAPYWDPYARGAILGLTRGSGKAQIVRATLESLALQSMDLIDLMVEETGQELSLLKVDGGASSNDFLMQFQADILDKRVIRPKSVETTSLGAAYLAGLHTGYWEDIDELISNDNTDKEFTPLMEKAKRTEKINDWHKAVGSVLGWSKK